MLPPVKWHINTNVRTAYCTLYGAKVRRDGFGGEGSGWRGRWFPMALSYRLTRR